MKSYAKSLMYVYDVFGYIPKWILKKLEENLERTKNQDLSNIHLGLIWI